jgi:hypothetical protein
MLRGSSRLALGQINVEHVPRPPLRTLGPTPIQHRCSSTSIPAQGPALSMMFFLARWCRYRAGSMTIAVPRQRDPENIRRQRPRPSRRNRAPQYQSRARRVQTSANVRITALRQARPLRFATASSPEKREQHGSKDPYQSLLRQASARPAPPRLSVTHEPIRTSPPRAVPTLPARPVRSRRTGKAESGRQSHNQRIRDECSPQVRETLGGII